MVWQFAEAKASLDEIFTRTIAEGPQFITRRDQEIVLLSKDDYLELMGEKPDFAQHLLNIPKVEDIDLTRDRSPMREVDLGE